MDRLTIVMTIVRESCHGFISQTHDNHDNHERFFTIGLPTLQAGIKWADLDQFLVILPSRDKVAFQARIDTLDARYRPFFKLVCEESLIGHYDGMEKTRIQMYCKLAIAKLVRTRAYLIIDDDCVLLRPFGMQDLYVDSSCKKIKFSDDSTFHIDWYEGSAAVLKMDWSDELPRLEKLRQMRPTRIIGVTPEAFETAAVLRLLRSLGHGCRKRLLLAPREHRWTEYTLYWLYLIREGTIWDIHGGSKLRFTDASKNVWYKTNDLVAKLRLMRSQRRSYFGVIQSNVAEHTPEYVLNAWIASSDVI